MAAKSRSESQRVADREFIRLWHEARKGGLTVDDMADRLGVAARNVYERRRGVERRTGETLPGLSREAIGSQAGSRKPLFMAQDLPSELPSYDELVAQRLKSTKRKLTADRARELIDMRVHVAGPYGIALIGDPHIDNPGCNLELLLAHTDIIRDTEGMFAICVGDLQDNWIGRLARLWAGQGISAAESQVLVDGWLKSFNHKLLALILGNHDCWAASMHGVNPTDWIKSHGTVQDAHGVRLRLKTDDGDVRTINTRHDFAGRSQYNAAHGPNKSLLFGCRDDVAVAGHTHEFGMQVRLNPETRTPMHAIRLGSYKHSDEYAKQLGLMDNNVTECAVFMVDPAEPDPRHRTWIETSPFRAARTLMALRGKRKAA